MSAAHSRRDGVYDPHQRVPVGAPWPPTSTSARPTYLDHRGSAGPTPLSCAITIGERLCQDAIRTRDGLSWLGVRRGVPGRWPLGPAGRDLYSGVPGIALFLAQLGACTGLPGYTQAAQDGLGSLDALLAGAEQDAAGIGLFTGRAGLAYVLGRLGVLWADQRLLARAQVLLLECGVNVGNDDHLDLCSGAAGLILTCLAAPSPWRAGLGGIAEIAGTRLLETARQRPSGLDWSTGKAQRPAGMLYGGSGVALALGKLAAHTGRHDLRVAAIAALRQERATFQQSSDDAGTVDLHTMSGVRSVSWCQGLTGLGLARIALLDGLAGHDPVLEEDAADTVELTLAYGFGGSRGACHGDLGNLELVLAAERVLRHRGARRRRADLLAATIADGVRTGWSDASPAATATPGLMTGLAGMGYQLLRMETPESVPSLLTLDPGRAG